MLRFFEKKVLGGCKSQIFFFGDQNAGRGDRMAEVRRRSKRHGDGFARPGGHSANLEAWRSFCGAHGAPALPPPLMFKYKLHSFISKLDQGSHT